MRLWQNRDWVRGPACVIIVVAVAALCPRALQSSCFTPWGHPTSSAPKLSYSVYATRSGRRAAAATCLFCQTAGHCRFGACAGRALVCARRAVGFDQFTAAELRKGLSKLGFGYGKKWTKGKLVAELKDMRITAKRISNALGRESKKRTSADKAEAGRASSQRNQQKDRSARKGGETQARCDGKKSKTATHTRFEDFKLKELHKALNDLGIEGTGDWEMKDCIKLLKKLNLSPRKVHKVLQTKQKNQRRKPRPSSYDMPGVEDEDIEWVMQQLADGDPDFMFDFSRRKSKRGRQRRRRDDDYYTEVAGDFDSFEDYVMFRDVFDAQAREQRQARQRRAEWPFAGEGYGRPDPRGHREVPRSGWPHTPPWQQSPAPAPAPPPDAAEGMAMALRQKWSPDTLSQAQARSILGLSAHHSTEELRSARKQSLIRWHPDRNPDRADASSALRLVLAAAAKLGG